MSSYPMLAVSGCFILLVTLLPLWRNPHWIIRGLDFPRQQIATLALLLLSAQLVLLPLDQWPSWLLIAVNLGCLGWQLRLILPYTRLWPVEVRAAKTVADADEPVARQISILNANVLMTNRDASRLLALVQRLQPDILVTLESDLWWQEQLAGLGEHMPHRISCPLDNLYGMHVWSRLPLEEPSIDFRVQEGIPSMHAWLRLADGQRVEVYFLHPAPPSPTENAESTERDQELIKVARLISRRPRNWPVLVSGDLNDSAWSASTRLFRKISGLLDPRIGRGTFSTFHARYPFLRWPLDHLFHSRHFTLVQIERGSYIGSDHFPLYARLELHADPVPEQDGISADEEDRRWAQEVARGNRAG